MKETETMEAFEYIIKDRIGLHARPAGLLVKQVKAMESKITLRAKGKSVNAGNVMAIMGLGIKEGEKVFIELEGSKEKEERQKLEAFFLNNL